MSRIHKFIFNVYLSRVYRNQLRALKGEIMRLKSQQAPLNSQVKQNRESISPQTPSLQGIRPKRMSLFYQQASRLQFSNSRAKRIGVPHKRFSSINQFMNLIHDSEPIPLFEDEPSPNPNSMVQMFWEEDWESLDSKTSKS